MEIDALKKSERYSDFTLLNAPVEFCKFAEGKNYPVVQVHDATPISSITNKGTSEENPEIIGFCGAFSWINGKLDSLDGDTYSEHMPVLGYSEFEIDEKVCLDILVSDW